MDIKDFIQAMPKAELHVHLEGCLTPSLAKSLADRNNMTLPESVEQASHPDGFVFHDLTSFCEIYFPAMTVLQNEQDFHDLAWDYLTKARAQNVRHCELFTDPQAHTTRSVPISTVINGYHSALARAKTELSMSASLILCFMREMSAASAVQTLQDALPYRDKFIGIGLDSDERDNPPSKFAEVYQLAARHGLHRTAHCDTDEENALTHINEALHVLGVERIDHGTDIIASPELTAYIVEKNIGLTCCPISNSVIASAAKIPEIVQLMSNGVKVTVNSDDPAYFRGYVNENFVLINDSKQTRREDLVRLARNSFEISWISNAERDTYLIELDDFARNAGVSCRE